MRERENMQRPGLSINRPSKYTHMGTTMAKGEHPPLHIFIPQAHPLNPQPSQFAWCGEYAERESRLSAFQIVG
jgi:hypothetical protein